MNSRLSQSSQITDKGFMHTFLYFMCLLFSLFKQFGISHRLHTFIGLYKNIKLSTNEKPSFSCSISRTRGSAVQKESRIPSCKGATQVDYIIAAGIFLVFFALSTHYITDYFASVKDTADVMALRSQAINLLSAVDRNFDPPTWPQIANGSNDLILLLHFNNDTLDYSGKGNNGTINNGANCSASVVGRFFSACSFDGIDDFINLTTFHTNLTAFTIEAWVNVKNITNTDQQAIVSKDRADSRSFMLNIANTASCANKTKVERGSSNLICGNTVISPNVWYHLAVTSNGTNYTLYVNGSNDNSNTSTELPNLADAWLIGQRNLAGADAEQFNGTIDEMAIYNRSLTAAEVREHYQQSLNRIGLRTDAYRFIVVVNNTSTYLRNTSMNVSEIPGELVRINMSTLGFTNIDYNSILIYGENNSIQPYQIDGSNITFNTTVSLNGSVQFTVYFDDDSVFPVSRSTIAGTDNLTETVQPAEKIPVLQYFKLRHLNETNYTNIKNTADIESSFSIKVYDIDSNTTFMDFGGAVPRRGDIIALQRFALFQNSTAGIRNGRLTVQAW